MKGADVVMSGIVQYNDWLEEEVCSVCPANVKEKRINYAVV